MGGCRQIRGDCARYRVEAILSVDCLSRHKPHLSTRAQRTRTASALNCALTAAAYISPLNRKSHTPNRYPMSARWLFLLLGALLLPQISQAAYSDGLAAYEAQDYPRAFQAWQAAATHGDSAAQASLAIMYHQGDGVAQNDALAAVWMRKAADQGSAAAEVFLGSMYFDGQGVPKDDAQAVVWFRRAAGQNSARAQDLLGTMYYRGGVGIERNPSIAVAWFKQAAAQGYVASQYNLAICYDDGDGVKKDTAQALVWLRLAAQQAYAPAMRVLGQHYLAGQGVAKNSELAYIYFDLALRNAGGSNDPAPGIAQLRDSAASQLDATALRQAQDRASNWRPAQPLP